jgi:hypothetical protein
MATTATAHSASQAANTWVSAQSSMRWSAKTTKAATPAANIQVAKVLVDVLAAGLAVWRVGNWPKTVLEVLVFIFRSLDMFCTLWQSKTIKSIPES